MSILLFLKCFGRVDSNLNISIIDDSNLQLFRRNWIQGKDVVPLIPKELNLNTSTRLFTFKKWCFLSFPEETPSKWISTSSALLDLVNPILIGWLDEIGRIRGRKASVLGAKKLRTPQSKVGWRIGPPADKECPEEPVALAKIIASAYKKL